MNAKLTQDELQAIKERAEKATPGPWRWTDTQLIPEVGREAVVWGNFNGEARAEDYDAEFIAAARQDVPKLLAEIERLQAEVHEHSAHNGQLIATHVIPTKEENKRLRKALEFYADKTNYNVYTDASNNCPTTNTLMDDGHTAREALK